MHWRHNRTPGHWERDHPVRGNPFLSGQGRVAVVFKADEVVGRDGTLGAPFLKEGCPTSKALRVAIA